MIGKIRSDNLIIFGCKLQIWIVHLNPALFQKPHCVKVKIVTIKTCQHVPGLRIQQLIIIIYFVFCPILYSITTHWRILKF
jgi:hypothetical protein